MQGPQFGTCLRYVRVQFKRGLDNHENLDRLNFLTFVITLSMGSQI